MHPLTISKVVDALRRDDTRLLALQVALREAGFLDVELPAAA
jgi:hypothetical protein